MEEISKSKYGLDINGVGDPNKKAYEIFASGSLRLGEENELDWSLGGEELSAETMFSGGKDFKEKLRKLEEDPELYKKCITNQERLVSKYCTKESIRKYITEKM
jgi:hypothetical protein